MSAERVERLRRLAVALESRRRLAGLNRAALEAEIAACEARALETLAFAETAPAQGPLGRALTRRLADLDRARVGLGLERDALAAQARRDRRLSRGVGRLADRLDEVERRRLEWAFLEAWLDASFGRPPASPPASPPAPAPASAPPPRAAGAAASPSASLPPASAPSLSATSPSGAAP